MKTPDLWPETERASAFGALSNVFENLPPISVLHVPTDVPKEQVDAWVAAHRKPAKIQFICKYE